MAKPLALTIGEPAGIGPDIAFAAWLRRSEFDLPAFYLLADPAFVLRRIERMGLRVPAAVVTPSQACSAFKHSLPLVDIAVSATAEPVYGK